MALDIRLGKADLAERIKRRLGYPVVKVELTQEQIYDCIDYARDKWIKWAVGEGTVETFFTVLLSAGENFYDLPIGVTEVVDYHDHGASYGINTLFTIDNFLFSRGVYDPLIWTGGYAYSLVSYHIARDFLKTVDRYTPSIYNYKYHKYTNQLEVQPAPVSGSVITVVNANGKSVEVNSPGFILLRTFMLEGSHYAGMTRENRGPWKRTESTLHGSTSDSNFFTEEWIFDYALAEAKMILGRIRVKFQNFNSIGNIGIAMDGDQLISEATTEKERLEERLRLEEGSEGYPIFWG